MDEMTQATTPTRRARVARSGLLGLAAAGLVGAVALAAGAGILPGGTFAASDTATTATATQQGPGGPDGDHGPRGGMGQHGPITVTAISGSSVSLATADGWTRTIAIASDTTVEKAGATIALSAVKVGDEVRLQQTRQADGSFHIDKLVVVLPHLGGQVTAIDGSTITVTLRDGTTATITVASGATITIGDAIGSLSDVKVGMVVMAEGTKTGDASLTANALRAFDPANAPMRDGHGPRGGMGGGFGPGPGGPNAPAPGTGSNG